MFFFDITRALRRKKAIERDHSESEKRAGELLEWTSLLIQ